MCVWGGGGEGDQVRACTFMLVSASIIHARRVEAWLFGVETLPPPPSHVTTSF